MYVVKKNNKNKKNITVIAEYFCVFLTTFQGEPKKEIMLLISGQSCCL